MASSFHFDSGIALASSVVVEVLNWEPIYIYIYIFVRGEVRPEIHQKLTVRYFDHFTNQTTLLYTTAD
jgi:hypothetical protein